MAVTSVSTSELAVAALGALAQETRLSVFKALVQAGPDGLRAGELGRAAKVMPSALTFHLKCLASAGLVTSIRNGRFVIYRANYVAMDSLVSFLTENCCAGHGCGASKAELS